MSVNLEQRELDRKVSEVGENDRIAAWVEPLLIGFVGIFAWWVTRATWVAVFCVALWGLRVLMRELAHLRQLLYWYHTAQEEQHLRSRVVLGWLLARSDAPERPQEAQVSRDHAKSARAGEDHSFNAEWLEERITEYRNTPTKDARLLG